MRGGVNEMNDTDAFVVLCTAPDADTAGPIAETLVGERLAACVNIVPGIRSIYRWQGNVEDDTEVLMIIKTRGERFDALRRRIEELHPYEVPEVLALPVREGAPAYLAWLIKETATE